MNSRTHTRSGLRLYHPLCLLTYINIKKHVAYLKVVYSVDVIGGGKVKARAILRTLRNGGRREALEIDGGVSEIPNHFRKIGIHLG